VNFCVRCACVRESAESIAIYGGEKAEAQMVGPEKQTCVCMCVCVCVCA